MEQDNVPIKELHRQFKAAESRLSDASKSARAAKRRYTDALCKMKIAEFEAAGGVVGVSKVWAFEYGASNPCKSKGPFFVMGADVPYGRPRFILSKVKRDGTPSKAPAGIMPERVAIIQEDEQ